MSLNLVPYSEKSFKVEGDTKTYRQELKDLGGKFNPWLRGGPGWIFSNKRRSSIEDFINSQEESHTKDSDSALQFSDLPILKKEQPSEEDSSSEDVSSKSYDYFDIGDKVAINTAYGGHQSWIFGKVIRKTAKTMDILTYKVEADEMYAGPGGHMSRVWPNWDVPVPGGKIKVWKTKNEGYLYEKDHLVNHFNDRSYDNSAYY